MPEKLDRCVEGLLAKWRDNPDEAPKKYKSGDAWKEIKDDDDRRSAAFGICRASTGLAESWADTLVQIEDDLVSAILAEGGDGPVLRGVAFVNRPYIKFMDPLEVVYRNGKEMIKAQLVRFGIYRHPNGPDGKLPFTRKFWSKVRENFKNNIYGQKIFADKRHDPNAGSFGELEEWEETASGVNGYFDPTPAGLQAVKNKDVNYASIDLVFNYKDTLVEAVASEDQVLEEADIPNEVFVRLSSGENLSVASEDAQNKVEVSEMPDKNKSEPGTETAVDLSEIEARLAKLEEREQQLQLTEKQVADKLKAIEDREAAFELEQSRRRETLRRESVKVFLAEQSQPQDGKCFDKGLLDLVEAILTGDTVTGSDGTEIQLAEDANVAQVHGYYRPAVEELLTKIPRTVPVQSKVDTEDKRPSNKKVELSEARKRAYDIKVLAIQNERGHDYQLTEEDEAQVQESLDRTFGVREE